MICNDVKDANPGIRSPTGLGPVSPFPFHPGSSSEALRAAEAAGKAVTVQVAQKMG